VDKINKKDNNKNIKKFYELDHQERLQYLKKEARLTEQDSKYFKTFQRILNLIELTI
jgi:hypothetical protein